MKALGVLLPAALAAAAVLSVSPAQAADECRGLQVCIPVAGPWVVVPAPSGSIRYPARSWRLKCPRGSIVGGVDARLTDRSLDLSFSGLLGSPVNPGVTTTDEVVFTATYTGRGQRASAFRPFVGCIPTAGGGRIPTAYHAPAAFKPGRPTVLRVRSQTVRPGRSVRITQTCRGGERLVTGAHAVGLREARQPTLAQLAAVRSTLARHGDRLVAVALVRRTAPPLGATLQVIAVCTRGAGQP